MRIQYEWEINYKHLDRIHDSSIICTYCSKGVLNPLVDEQQFNAPQNVKNFPF